MNTQAENDMDRMDQMSLALEQAKTMFHAQIKELGCGGGNQYVYTLASVGMDICEGALKTTAV